MAGFEHLSTELVQKIYRQIETVQGVTRLSEMSKFFNECYKAQRLIILTNAVETQYSPVRDLIQLSTSKNDKSVHVSRDPPMTVGLLVHMVQFGKVAERWVSIYPQLRWAEDSDNRRSLREHEIVRLRRAIYRHWTYGNAFHSRDAIKLDMPRPSCDSESLDDVRFFLLRTYTTHELYQVAEFDDMMKKVISNNLCPSDAMIADRYSQSYLGYNHFNLGSLVAREGWGNQTVHQNVVQDMLKLNPAQILNLLDKTFTKFQRLDYLNKKADYFWDAPATLRVSIQAVATDRDSYLDVFNTYNQDSVWGITDHPEEDPVDRGYKLFGNDSSPTGHWVQDPYDRECPWCEEEDGESCPSCDE
jgi:hypothetical protein